MTRVIRIITTLDPIEMTVDGLTDEECDAVAALLAERLARQGVVVVTWEFVDREEPPCPPS